MKILVTGSSGFYGSHLIDLLLKETDAEIYGVDNLHRLEDFPVDPFEIIEPLLQREEFPIFVLTIINKIQSDTVMNTLLDSIEKGIKEKSDTRLSNQR